MNDLVDALPFCVVSPPGKRNPVLLSICDIGAMVPTNRHVCS